MRVADAGFWGMVGARGLVVPGRGEEPELVKIPEYSGGPLIRVVPTQTEATYRVSEGRLRVPTSVTVTGRPVRERESRGGTPIGEVSFTWDDPTLALASLPAWVRGWVERHQLIR